MRVLTPLPFFSLGSKEESFLLKSGEHIEPLGKNVSVIVNKLHHFSTDTVLLADFACKSKAKSAVDLGSGCGTIALLWSKTDLIGHIDAVEIQHDAADMIRRSIEYNRLENRISAVNCDMKQLRGVLPFGSYDLAACNPPYKLGGSGVLNPDPSKTAARHETFCTVDDVTETASRLLQFGGRFCICQRPERLTDVLLSMRKNSIEPKRLRFVQQRLSKEPKLFLAEGRKGGKPGFMKVEKTLFIENESGSFSDEMLEIYGDYKQKGFF